MRESGERTDLDSVTSVNLGLTLVVLPDNSELDNSLRDLWHQTRRGFKVMMEVSSCFRIGSSEVECNGARAPRPLSTARRTSSSSAIEAWDATKTDRTLVRPSTASRDLGWTRLEAVACAIGRVLPTAPALGEIATPSLLSRTSQIRPRHRTPRQTGDIPGRF
jgi:hypothetical protein